MKSEIATINDSVFVKIVIFILSFCLVRYFRNIYESALLAIVLAICFCSVLSYNRRKATHKYDNMQEVFNQFAYNDISFCLQNLHLKLKTIYTATLCDEYVLIDSSHKTIVFPFFNLVKLTPNDLTRYYITAKSKNADRILILTIDGATATVTKTLPMLTDIDITILSGTKTYDFLYNYRIFPQLKIKLNQPKHKFLSSLSLSLTRGNAKSYISIGTLFFFMSFILRNNWLYLSFTIIAGLLALVSYLNPGEKLGEFIALKK